MKPNDQISDELINSFVDEQLSSAEKSEMLEAINKDEELSARVCEAQRLKVLVSHAYQRPPQPKSATSRRSGLSASYWNALAASVLLMVGSTSGWLAHHWLDAGGAQSSVQAAYTLKPGQIANDWSGQEKVVLHIGSSEPRKLQASLDRAEYLLNHFRKAGQPANVELLVSGGGLNLLRADVSPHAERIRTMQAAYDNLIFVVCNQSIERLREKGVDVKLLPEARQAPDSALDEVVLRLRQGWNYVSI